MIAQGLDASFAAYLTFTAILVVTPGSTTAVVVRNTLQGGRRAGLVSAVGAAVGNSTHATLAGFGLSMLMTRWPAIVDGVRVMGAAYLAWLGAASLWSAWMLADGGLNYGDAAYVGRSYVGRHFSGASHAAKSGATEVAPHGTKVAPCFRDGLAINVLNPTIISFYVAIVPSFIPAGAPRSYFAVLAASHVGMALVCHAMWAMALDAVRRWFAPPIARRALTAATGIALIALAVRVLWPS